MSVGFFSSGSTRLTDASPPVTSFPFTVGFWVYPTTTGTTRTFWSLGNNASTTNRYRIGQANTNNWFMGAFATTDSVSTVGTVTANQWAFVVVRIISATNRWLQVLEYNGVYSSVQGTQSRTPSVNQLALGGTVSSTPAEFSDAAIGDYWLCDADIGQNTAAALEVQIMRTLAYEGPLSMPHLQGKLREHWTFWGGHKNITRQTFWTRSRSPYLWTESATPPVMTPDPPALHQRQSRGYSLTRPRKPAPPAWMIEAAASPGWGRLLAGSRNRRVYA